MESFGKAVVAIILAAMLAYLAFRASEVIASLSTRSMSLPVPTSSQE